MGINFTRIEVETGKFRTSWFLKTQLLFKPNRIESKAVYWFTFNCQIFNQADLHSICNLHAQPQSKVFWNVEMLSIAFIKNADRFSLSSLNLNKFIETYSTLIDKTERVLLPLFITCCINNRFYVLTIFEFENFIINAGTNSKKFLTIFRSKMKLTQQLKINIFLKSEIEIRFLTLFKMLTLWIPFMYHVICKR